MESKLEIKAVLKKLINKLSGGANTFDDYITTDSGLKYKDIKVGKGILPEFGDNVIVNYTGWLNNFNSSDKFESSYDLGIPILFTIGTGKVIKGWDEAILTNMPVGTVRQVIIPPELGYGKNGHNPIPPNATLYFKMELIGIDQNPRSISNADLLEILVEKTDLKKKDVESVLTELSNIISKEVVNKGSKITVKNLGRFEQKVMNDRPERNPVVGQDENIPKIKKVSFIPSGNLKKND